MFKFKPFAKLRANGFHPFVVSLSNHRGRLLDSLLVLIGYREEAAQGEHGV